MAISKKYRRKIIRHGKIYFWYVNSDYDDEGKINVHILSEDKKFIVTYEIGQVSKQRKEPFVVVVGKEFEGYVGKREGYIRVQTPLWDDFSATPGLVGEIIDWCYTKKEEITLVDWMGTVLSNNQTSTEIGEVHP